MWIVWVSQFGTAEQIGLELRELLVFLRTQSRSNRLFELGTRRRIGWGSKPKISQGVQQLRRLQYHLPVVLQHTLYQLQHLRTTKLEVQYENLASNKPADAKTLRSFPSSPCLHLASSSIQASASIEAILTGTFATDLQSHNPLKTLLKVSLNVSLFILLTACLFGFAC